MATKVITTTQVTKNLQHGFYQANGVKDTPALLNTIIYIFSNNCFTWAIKRALLRLIPYVNLKLCFKSNWKYIEFDTDFLLWWNVLFEIYYIQITQSRFLQSLGLPFTIECGWEKIYGCVSRECKWPWMVWKWQPKLLSSGQHFNNNFLDSKHVLKVYFKPSRKNQDFLILPRPSKLGSMKNDHLRW